MSGLGRMMVGGQQAAPHCSLINQAGLNGGVPHVLGNERDAHDFYPTPIEATLALMRAEDAMMPYRVWEPACGDGAIAKILRHHNRQVRATDLIGRGYGEGGHDFLLEVPGLVAAPAIVTNPPFNLAAKFIEKSRSLRVPYLALLLKATFWHAACRSGLFENYSPQRIYALTWRLDFRGLKAPTMECAWFVWDAAAPDQTTRYQLMHHPLVAQAKAQSPFFVGF